MRRNIHWAGKTHSACQKFDNLQIKGFSSLAA
jgi:hypothetical protein